MASRTFPLSAWCLCFRHYFSSNMPVIKGCCTWISCFYSALEDLQSRSPTDIYGPRTLVCKTETTSIMGVMHSKIEKEWKKLACEKDRVFARGFRVGHRYRVGATREGNIGGGHRGLQLDIGNVGCGQANRVPLDGGSGVETGSIDGHCKRAPAWRDAARREAGYGWQRILNRLHRCKD